MNQATYNKGEIILCLENFNNGYEDLKRVLQNQMQNDVLNSLAQVWCDPDAANVYGPSQETEWNQMCVTINADFERINSRINRCAQNYAEACGDEWAPQPWRGSPAKVKNNFQETDSKGNSGINNLVEYHKIRTVNLNKISTDSDTILQSICRNCIKSGFIDGVTEESIIRDVNNMSKKIKQGVNDAKQAIENKTAVKEDTIRAVKNTNASTN